MNIYKRQGNKQVFFSLEFVSILLQIEAKAVKNASSLLKFSGHSELENGLFVFGNCIFNNSTHCRKEFRPRVVETILMLPSSDRKRSHLRAKNDSHATYTSLSILYVSGVRPCMAVHVDRSFNRKRVHLHCLIAKQCSFQHKASP